MLAVQEFPHVRLDLVNPVVKKKLTSIYLMLFYLLLIWINWGFFMCLSPVLPLDLALLWFLVDLDPPTKKNM